MKILCKIHIVLIYLFRFFLAYVFIPHGIEKISTRIDVQEYHDFGLGQNFIDFYLIFEKTGYMVFIGYLQLIIGVLLIPKRTYLLAAVMLLPLNIGMVACHVYLSGSMDFLIWDLGMTLINLYLIMAHYKQFVKLFWQKQSTWI